MMIVDKDCSDEFPVPQTDRKSKQVNDPVTRVGPTRAGPQQKSSGLSGGSRISMSGMRRGSGPQFFSEGMTPTSYGRLLARICVATIFRGSVRPGVDPGFLVGGRWRGRRPRRRRGRREVPER